MVVLLYIGEGLRIVPELCTWETRPVQDHWCCWGDTEKALNTWHSLIRTEIQSTSDIDDDSEDIACFDDNLNDDLNLEEYRELRDQ